MCIRDSDGTPQPSVRGKKSGSVFLFAKRRKRFSTFLVLLLRRRRRPVAARSVPEADRLALEGVRGLRDTECAESLVHVREVRVVQFVRARRREPRRRFRGFFFKRRAIISWLIDAREVPLLSRSRSRRRAPVGRGRARDRRSARRARFAVLASARDGGRARGQREANATTRTA